MAGPVNHIDAAECVPWLSFRVHIAAPKTRWCFLDRRARQTSPTPSAPNVYPASASRSTRNPRSPLPCLDHGRGDEDIVNSRCRNSLQYRYQLLRYRNAYHRLQKPTLRVLHLQPCIVSCIAQQPTRSTPVTIELSPGYPRSRRTYHCKKMEMAFFKALDCRSQTRCSVRPSKPPPPEKRRPAFYKARGKMGRPITRLSKDQPQGGLCSLPV